MKKNKYIYLCVGLLLCGIAAPAASKESSNDDIRKNFNRLVTTKQCPGCDLRGAVLTRMNLHEADLQGADLTGAKLSLANLSKANLHNAILRGAILGGADLAGADLRGADLTDAKLAGAYFKDALLDQEIMRDKPYEPEELPKVLAAEAADEESEGKTEIEEVERSSDPSVQTPVQEVFAPEQEPVESTGPADAAPALRTEDAVPPSVDSQAAQEDDSPVSVLEEEVAGEAEVPEQPVEAIPASDEKIPDVTLPDIGGRTETTLHSKELVPMADVQVADSKQEEPQTETKQAEKKTAELDETPVIDTAPEQAGGKAETEEGERGFWDSVTSLFTFSDGEEKKTEKTGLPSVETSAAVTQAETQGQSGGAEQQVGAYSVETFAQSRARLQGLAKKLIDEKRCVSCELAGIDLRGKDLEEADLERANFSGAQLEGADLRSANLKGVNFTDANLKNADLRKADLYLADFTNADLTGARMEGALTDSTDFTGVIGFKLDAAQK